MGTRSANDIHADGVAAICAATGQDDLCVAFWIHAMELARMESFGASSNGVEALRLIDLTSYKAEGFRQSQLEQLSGLIDAFRTEGLCLTAGLLELFVFTQADIFAAEPPQAWCFSHVDELACRACGHTGRYQFWDFVHAGARPDLREAAREGRLDNVAWCHACGEAIGGSAMRYCDPSREEFLVVTHHSQPDSEYLDEYREFLLSLPEPLRCFKTDIYIIEGMPVALFREPHVAAVTICTFGQEFQDVVGEDVWNDVEPKDLGGQEDYFAGVKLDAEGRWREAASAFLRSFLSSPASVSMLEAAASCLANAGEEHEVDALLAGARSLRTKLIEAGVIKRIYRYSQPGGQSGDVIFQRIVETGLPPAWGFDDLIAQARRLSHG